MRMYMDKNTHTNAVRSMWGILPLGEKKWRVIGGEWRVKERLASEAQRAQRGEKKTEVASG
jgi:hypothetical protein